MKPIIFFLFFLLTAPSLAGGGGFGNIVYDPWNWGQNSQNTLKTILQLTEDVKRTQNDLRQIQQIYELLEKAKLNTTPLQTLYNNRVVTLRDQMNRSGELAFDVRNLNSTFHTLYPDWKDSSGRTPQEYNRSLENWERAARQNIRTTFQAQSIEPSIQAGRYTLDQLLSQNARSKGVLESMQVSNQIAGIVAEQLLVLNEMTAVQFRAQSAVALRDIERQRKADEYARKVRCGPSGNC